MCIWSDSLYNIQNVRGLQQKNRIVTIFVRLNYNEMKYFYKYLLYFRSLDYVVHNLSKYMNNEWADVLKHLPTHIKDRILHKFTKSPYFWQKVNFTKALTIFMHADTKEIDLTSCTMDNNVLNTIKECKNLNKLCLMQFGEHEMTSEG